MRGRAGGHAGERLSALLDDELGDDEALVVSRHVAGCGACMRELDELRRLRSTLRELDAPAPSFSWMVETVLLPVERRPDRRARRAAGALALTGSTLVAMLALAYVLGGTEQGTVVPAVDMLVVDHVANVDGGPVMTPVGLDGPVVTAGP